MKYALFFFILLQGCASQQVSLTWNLNNSPKVPYQLARIAVDDKSLLNISGFDLANNPQKFERVIRKLQTSSIEDNAHMLMTMEALPRDQLRVHITSKEFDYQNPPQDEQEKAIREFRKTREGATQAVVNIDLTGQIDSFAIKKNVKNTLAVFLSLPHQKIGVNDYWSIPVSFMSIGAPFRLNSSKRINRVTLIGLTKDSENNTVATLLYNVSDKIMGDNVLEQEKKILPLDVEVSFIAIGEFVVDKNYWNKFIGYRITDYSKSVTKQSVVMYALKPILRIAATAETQ